MGWTLSIRGLCVRHTLATMAHLCSPLYTHVNYFALMTESNGTSSDGFQIKRRLRTAPFSIMNIFRFHLRMLLNVTRSAGRVQRPALVHFSSAGLQSDTGCILPSVFQTRNSVRKELLESADQ